MPKVKEMKSKRKAPKKKEVDADTLVDEIYRIRGELHNTVWALSRLESRIRESGIIEGPVKEENEIPF